MFFIMWFMNGRKELPFKQEMLCERCGEMGNLSVFMTYTTFVFFFIPTFKWGKRYFVQTDCCDTIYEIDKEPGRLIEKGVQIELEPSDFMQIRGFEESYRPVKRCANCGYSTDEEEFEFCPKCGKPF